MKFTHKVMVLVVLMVIVFSLVGCDGDGDGVSESVTIQQDAFVQDAQTAFKDSGAANLAGTIDNILVGGITGQDYTQ